MTEEFKLYRIRESSYGKEKDDIPADAFVAAKNYSEALRIFALNFGEPKDLNVSTESVRFLIGGE